MMQSEKTIQKIVIVGGGTAGWMTAAALSRYLPQAGYSIELVESDEIGTVGVGEATIPGIRDFNQKLGISESEFMRATNATFKLGIQFVNWADQGDAYIHPFGYYGHDLNELSFYHYWLKARNYGLTDDFGTFCIAHRAAEKGKFEFPNSDPRSPLSRFFYAFHFDAGLYAKFLRSYSEKNGVTRTEGKVENIVQDEQSGLIKSISLSSGKSISGDLFIDCSGFRGMLIEGVYKAGYHDWSHWLPCDRAIAVPCDLNQAPIPYTRATAHEAGWQWRIPLQNRIGNGMVFSSSFWGADAAENKLLENLDGKPAAETRLLKFVTGRRKKFWVKNCVAVGLSSGFLEPLESTSIHLIQTSIMKLVSFFPQRHSCEPEIESYNREMAAQFDQVKDFLILHYKATNREDSEFWRYCKNMSIPDSLSHKLALFEENGHIVDCQHEIFVETNWAAVLLGQKVSPKRYHPKVDALSQQQLMTMMMQMKTFVENFTEQMRPHETALKGDCLSSAAQAWSKSQ